MKYFKILFVILLSCAIPSIAQESDTNEEVNKDDLGNVADGFKENFFNALAQKAIGNCDRAIPLLERCAEMEPQNAAVQFELSKNYFASDSYDMALQYVTKAIELRGQDEWLLEMQYDIYEKQKNYEQALNTMRKLAAMNINYNEFLPALLYRTERYQEAYDVITQLDQTTGEDYRRTQLKKMLSSKLQQLARAESSITSLEQAIQNDQKDIQSYVNLIYLYSKEDNQAQIERVASLLLKNVPDSYQAHLALYKVYVDRKDWKAAYNSLKEILKSAEIQNNIKVKALTDFIGEVNHNEQAQDYINQAINCAATYIEDPNAFRAMGDYYLNNGDLNQAAALYKKGLQIDESDFELLKAAVLLDLDRKDFKSAATIAEKASAFYPAQPLFYLFNGVALNALNKPDQAIGTLEMGQAFLIDEKQVERDLLMELSRSYELLDDQKMKLFYQKKAAQIPQQ